MTVFEETFQEIESFGKAFDETANKIRVLTEYVVSDYNVDVASVKLEQKKDDTISDEQVSESLYEVTEKCNGKLRKTANSINRNSQDYFSKMNASLQKITNDPSYQETIDKAGALCKEYPKLGKVQVTYHAYEEEAKAIAKGMDQLQTVISKGKARKNFTEADSARIDEILNDVNKARQAAGKKDNTVTLTEGVSLLSALLIALKNQTAEKSTEKTDAPVDSMSPESSRIMLKAIGAQKQLAKSNVAVNTRGALSLRNGIKKAIKQKKSLEKAEAKEAKETKESVEDLTEDFAFESSDEDLVSDLDAAALLESVFEDLHTEPTPEQEPEEVTESVDDLETSIENHMNYMSQLETEILGFESTREETPEDDDPDKILEDAAMEATALAHSDPGDTDGPTNGDSSDSVKESEEEPVTEGFKDAVTGAAKKVSTNAKIAAASAADALEDAPKNASKKMAELKSDAKHAAAGAKKAMTGAASSAKQAAHNAASDVEMAAHKVANGAGNAATVAKIKKLIADGRYTQAKQALKTAQSSLDPKTVDSLVDQLKKLHDRFYESVDEDLENMTVTQESEEEPVTEEPIEAPATESVEDDDLDPEAMLDQAAMESGIEPETEEPVQESSDDIDIDALLTEAALNAGIEPDNDEVDALCEKYGVNIEESAEPETEEETPEGNE